MPHPPVKPLSDEQLASLAQQGCPVSFEQLMRKYQAPVLQFLRARGGMADSEDLLQETFLRAYTNLYRYQPRWRFATWLYTIARRLSINHYRRPRPETGHEGLTLVASAAPSPVEAAIREESRQSLWAAASVALSEEEQTALWLHYVEDMPVREIAAVLERTRVSVKTMMFRARKKLLPLLPALVEQGQEHARAAAVEADDVEVASS